MKIGNLSILLRGTAVALLLVASAPAAFAQQPPNPNVVRVRGTVETISGRTLVVKAADGTASTIGVASSTVYVARQSSSLDAIKPGDFVASAAVKGPDGKLHSTELRIFPEALRGLGEGQRPMNEPNTMMTNATVSAVVVPPSKVEVAPEGRVVKVKYQGGDSELVVGPEVKIIALVVTPIVELKPGAAVLVNSTKAADGSLLATTIMAN